MDFDINNNNLQLLDIIGTPKNENLLFSSLNDYLIYSIGANIIFYNLRKNTKTFLQNYYKTEISTYKFLDSKEQLVLIISKSQNPLLSIWKLPFIEEIFSSEILFEKKFNFTGICIEKIYSNLFIIIISSLDCNLLYCLKHENYANFTLEKICQINSDEIKGFKCFYDDIYLIFISNNTLLYYLIDTKKIFQENKNTKDIIQLYQKISFPFKLVKNSIQISNKYKLIFFLTSKGNCLIYNKKGESIKSINPLNNEENFVSIFLDDNSLCLGTDATKIYIYNISTDFKLKFYIKEKSLVNIKLNFLLNNIDNTKEITKRKIKIDYIYLNEKLDKIFIKLNNNSIIFAPFTSLLTNNDTTLFFNSLGNTTCLYSFNHFGAINSLEINNNYNEYETIIYSCAKDATLIQYNIDFSTNKLSNVYFDLSNILSNNNDSNIINKNDMHYLTIIKFKPNDNTKLFAGDNKGFLYIFDIKEKYFQYKKFFISENSIENISFSKEGNLICIGILTGKNMIFDINKNCEFCLKLNEDFLLQKEIDNRISNYHVISYGYFFTKEKHQDCIIFLKNTKNVEFSKLFYEKKKLIKKKITLIEFQNDILDIQIHTSENYLIILNTKNSILINEINLGETTAVIDLGNQINKVHNFFIDKSGLYMFIICSENYNCNDLIILEIGTGEIISYIKCIGKIYKLIFDYYSKYIIMGSKDGILSLWKIPDKIKQLMINVLTEIEKNENYWEQFEIKYYNKNGNDNTVNENGLELPKKYNTEISRHNEVEHLDEFENNGPHKGIQTWTNDIKNIKNKKINENYIDDNNLNIVENSYENKNKEIPYNKKNIEDYKINSYIPNNIGNNNKNNNSDEIFNSNIETSNKSRSIKTTTNKNKKLNELDKNLKEENTLQNCYEKFKKERLMKNSFIKPNNNNAKTKLSKAPKTKSFSSNKIKPNKNTKYLKQTLYNNNNKNNPYNKKENDSIDFEIDFDINKIRPNFDPNLYSDNINQKYSSISKELIKPYLTKKNYENDFLRYNGNEYDKNFKNDNEYKNISSNHSNNNNYLSQSNKMMNKSRTSKKEENSKINEAMNILMQKDKDKSEYRETHLSNNAQNKNNININNKSISSKDISHDFAYINNERIEPSKINDFSSEFSKKNNNNNNYYNSNTNNFNSNTTNYYNSNNINSLTTDKNVLSKNVESISTRKRNMINDKINNFENRLNYY